MSVQLCNKLASLHVELHGIFHGDDQLVSVALPSGVRLRGRPLNGQAMTETVLPATRMEITRTVVTAIRKPRPKPGFLVAASITRATVQQAAHVPCAFHPLERDHRY